MWVGCRVFGSVYWDWVPRYVRELVWVLGKDVPSVFTVRMSIS